MRRACTIPAGIATSATFCNIITHLNFLECFCVPSSGIKSLDSKRKATKCYKFQFWSCHVSKTDTDTGLGRVNSYQQSTRGDPRVPHITHPWWRRLLGSTSSHLMTAMGDTYDAHMRANCNSSNVCGRLPYFTKLSFWVSGCFRLYHAVRFF